MILAMRIAADIFWQYKFINALVGVSVFIFALFRYMAQRNSRHGMVKKEIVLLFTMMVVAAYSYLIDMELGAAIIFGKLLATYSIFLLGVTYTEKIENQKLLENIALFLIPALLFLSVVNYGYIHWGNTKTFVGFYFFKADFAIAVVVFLIIILRSDFNVKLKSSYFAISLYLIFISNSRIHFLSSIGVYFLWFFTFNETRFKLNVKKLILIFLFSIGSLYIYFELSSAFGFLSIDTSSGLYTGGNTQGRDKIWSALIESFANSNIFEQLFGRGFLADIKYAYAIDSNGIDIHNSHNTYLFVMASQGYVGLTIFFMFNYLVLKKFVRLQSSLIINRQQRKILFSFMAFYFIFILGGITSTLIIFQQLSWFFFFYAGALFSRVFK